jgi:hypothetical protein
MSNQLIIDRINEHVAELQRDRGDAGLHVVDFNVAGDGTEDQEDPAFRLLLTFTLSDRTRFTLPCTLQDFRREMEAKAATQSIFEKLR